MRFFFHQTLDSVRTRGKTGGGSRKAARVGHETVACFTTWFAPCSRNPSRETSMSRDTPECPKDWGSWGRLSDPCSAKHLGYTDFPIPGCIPPCISAVPGFPTCQDRTWCRGTTSFEPLKVPTFGYRHTRCALFKLHPLVTAALQKLVCVLLTFAQEVLYPRLSGCWGPCSMHQRLLGR